MKKIILFLPIVMILSCGERGSTQATTVEIDYQQIGDSITMISAQTLLSNVAREIQAGGPANAVDFCNVNAMKITDSLSKKYKVRISRIAERNRNSNNAAAQQEIELMETMLANKQKDTLLTNGKYPKYYKNILVGMPTCLKCHGSQAEISDSTRMSINERYPHDNATGFKMGDLRGAWRIIFNQQD